MATVEFLTDFLKDYAMTLATTLATIALVIYTAKLHSATKRYADITEKMLQETGKQIAASEAMVEETKNQVKAIGNLVDSILHVPKGIEKAIEPLTQKAREEMAAKHSEKRDEMQKKEIEMDHTKRQKITIGTSGSKTVGRKMC